MNDSVPEILPGGRVQRALRGGILWYQRAREGRPSPCRFFPSCSAYALEAVEVHGAGRGSWLATRRLLRCRPLGPSGFDPVPLPHDRVDHSVDHSVEVDTCGLDESDASPGLAAPAFDVAVASATSQLKGSR